jgi:predicted Zn-dependent protease
MQRRPVRRPFLPVLTLLILASQVTGCAVFAGVSDALFMMSPEQEIESGKQIATQIEKDLVFVHDPQVESYVRNLGERVWVNSRQGQIPARFFVIQDGELNAFAIPGGNVYVHTGLIQAAEDEAELAAVISHEVGHVIMRHGATHISRQMGLEMVQQLALGQEAGQATQIATQIVQSGIMTNYSRQDESEADVVAVETLYRMGYDPLAMRSFFAKLQAKYGEQGGPIAKFFASHPPTSERMNHVTQMVGHLPPKPYQRPVTDLRRIQGRLQQLGL